MIIYIVEDDSIIRNELMEFLSNYGFECIGNNDFENVADDILNSKPNLVILDLNLPYKDGFQICKEIRKYSSVPIVIVTSRNTPSDELLCLNIGADDFITKPYNLQILLAHIQSVLKRVNESPQSVILTYKELSLDVLKSKAINKHFEVELTKNELNILKLLIINKENITSREELMNELWQNDEFIDENTLNVNISRLRGKLGSIGLGKYLLAKRGLGYKL